MAKGGDGSPPQPSSASGKRPALRSKPYDPNDSFVKKVATKVTDLIPQRSWISKWFNNSQETLPQTIQEENTECEELEDQQLQPPPPKRPCIRMDVTHPPGTFSIKPRNRNLVNQIQPHREQFLNHNNTTAQDFSEPTPSGSKLPRFVASTPAFSSGVSKVPNSHSALNMLISETSNNGTTNGMDDNSESSESTSGCSSLVPQNNRQEAPVNTNFSASLASKRRCIEDKMSFGSQLRSSRSLFLDGNARETLSSRRPSFDPYVAVSNLDKSLSSPFYSGNTMFGGANAANLYRSNSILSDTTQLQLRAPNRASVEVKPSSESTTDTSSGMSQTARRILEALEQFSSPLADAKKMPVRNMNNLSWATSPTSSLARKRTREDETPSTRVGLRHLTRELVVPTIPDILRIRRKQKLQNTTMNARKIMNARSASDLASGEAERRDYQLRHDSPSQPKRNHMKATRKTNLMEEDTVEALNLPDMPLPVTSLPRFDFSLPQQSKPQSPEKLPVPNHIEDNESFKFASPIRLSDGAKNVESINNYTFSKPMSPSKILFNHSLKDDSAYEMSKTASLDSDDTLPCTPSFPNFLSSGPSSQMQFQFSSKKTESSVATKVASDLKTGSVMDFFASMAKQTTKLNESNVWECNECLIKNNESESHCVACKSSRRHDSSSSIEILDDDCEEISQDTKKSKGENKKHEKSSAPLPSLFGNTNFSPHLKPFSAISNNLNFNSNSNSSSSVIVLDSDDDDSRPEIVSIKPVAKNDPPIVSIAPKPAKNSWECPCCMVRNVETVTSCPCCNTAKPGSVKVSPKRNTSSDIAPPPTTSTNTTTTTSTGFGNMFKKPEGSWTCDTCMITNKSELSKCAACETPKPGSKPASTVSSSSSSTGFGDMFKKPTGSWTCDTCMITNKSELSKCAACETPKPGSITEPSKPTLQFKSSVPAATTTSGFKFGIDKAEDSTKSAISSAPNTNGFAFGNSSVSTASAGFSFGSPTSDKNKETSSTGFAFKPSESVTAAATFQFGAKPIETKDKEEASNASTAATFSFGAPPKDDSKIPSTGFVFGQSAVTSPTKGETENKTEAQPVVRGFSFGAPKSTDAPLDKSMSEKKSESVTTLPATSGFSFNAPTTSVSFASNVESKKTENLKEAPVSETPKMNFGDTSKAPSFSFNTAVTTAPASSTNSAAATPIFSFGAQSTAPKPFEFSKTPSNLFGKPEAASTSQSITSGTSATPMFGSGSAASSFSNPTNQATPSLFGNTSAASTPASGTTENKPSIFGSTVPENKVAPSFGEPKGKISAFGSTIENSKTSTFPTPNFGAAAASATTPLPPFGSGVFGSSASSSFGGNASSGSIFGTTKASETSTANPGLFTFGQSSQNTAAPTTGGFNFSSGSNASGNSNEQKQQQPGLFSFGASSGNASQVSAGGFGSSASSFGGSAVPSAASSSSFTFNAPVKPAESAGGFGQSATSPLFNAPAPMFNAPASNPAPPPAYPGTASPAPASTGFNFGSSNMPPSFNFGSGSAPATGSFTFNAPAPSASPAPAFDPNAQPTFNFTGGSAPTTFNATPTVGARKMKKAVRRMLPRQ
ncbi:hypothetical protein QAD02_009839 [Eretmocerus hayati]|uniref:Uncharacterized protein n=1 Tax=Eretmocerus hayati TaxID=131215 RepID=A0ACC2NB88_9HYME|nr:hypothetical protein QAD02_009839 [Eretmocerus hayati]